MVPIQEIIAPAFLKIATEYAGVPVRGTLRQSVTTGYINSDDRDLFLDKMLFFQ